MALLTDEQVSLHLRLDTTDDKLLVDLYVSAAIKAAENFIGHSIFEDQVSLDAAVAAGTGGDAPIMIDDAIRSALLLTIGHLYANREDTVLVLKAMQLPLGSQWLLMPYRTLGV